jgi:uncharacterized protein (DUF952 family)
MIVFHITNHVNWEQAKKQGQYTAPSLQTEGFIHASTLEQLVGTANRFYQGQPGLLLLKIDTNQVKSEVRFDDVNLDGEQTQFPHIYGPLNLEAVVEVLEFPPNADGSFELPAELTRRY